MEQEQIEIRKSKGCEIAKKFRIRKTDKGWVVPSQTGSGSYLVKMDCASEKCNCPDHELRQSKCKHIFAVEFMLKEEVDTDAQGNQTITRTKMIKITYPQDWKSYNHAQCNEQRYFMALLHDLVSNIEQPKYEFGRPKLPLQDMIFASALKVYSTFSLRRFMSDMQTAKEKNYVDNVCSYVTVSNVMRNKEITPILNKLIKISSLPLASIETKFAVDSSGFSTSRFARYFSFKHGKDMKYRTWIKAHVISGVKTNIITGIEISDENSNDCPYFEPLVNQTSEQGFKVDEVSADLAYSSKANHEIVNSLSGTAYIPFKSNVTGKADGSYTWMRMYHYFMLNKEEFLQHYHKRSNSETVFHMIKSKFRDHIRSKEKTAQINEVLLKALCHNICVVIQEMFELGISPQFCLKSQEDVKKVSLN